MVVDEGQFNAATKMTWGYMRLRLSQSLKVEELTDPVQLNTKPFKWPATSGLQVSPCYYDNTNTRDYMFI